MSAASAIQGQCLCGAVQYELRGPFRLIFNCHCRFCRVAHGASFTTVAIVAAKDFTWTQGSAARYVTPHGSARHFCGTCSAPLCNTPVEDGIVCIVMASLEVAAQRPPWFHANTEARAAWIGLEDGLPSFPAFPSPEEIGEIVAAQRSR